jgi:hypothetical protein
MGNTSTELLIEDAELDRMNGGKKERAGWKESV